MASTKGSRQDWITKTRQATRALMDAINQLNEQSAAWDAGMGTWIIDATGTDPTAPDYKANDFEGNEGLMKADMSAVTSTTLDALNAALTNDHKTNLEKIAQ